VIGGLLLFKELKPLSTKFRIPYCNVEESTHKPMAEQYMDFGHSPDRIGGNFSLLPPNFTLGSTKPPFSTL
jgi:hypothetical protein